MTRANEQAYKDLLNKEAEYWDYKAREMLEQGRMPDLQFLFSSSPFFRKEGAQAVWDDSQLNSFVRGKYLERLLGVCCYRPKTECLELGCGTGWLSLEAARRGANVTGIDISSGAMQITKNYLAKTPTDATRGSLNLVVADLNTIELPQETFDVVFVWDSLHHVVKVPRLVYEVHKALKGDGFFVVYDHARAPRYRAILAAAISILFLLILPTEEGKRVVLNKMPLITALRKIWYKGPINNKALLSAPFEDVSGENIIVSIRAWFEVIELHRYLSFSQHVVAKIRPHSKWRSALIRFLMELDHSFVFLRILKPECFFIVARKKTSS